MMTPNVEFAPNVFERPLLFDDAAEKITLGSMMLSPAAADEIFDIIGTDDFYRPKHTKIFAAVTAALAAGEPSDPVAITRLLAEAGELERVGGTPYLHELYSSPPTASQGAYYARIVADWAARRRIQVTAVRLEQLSGDLTRSVPDMIEAAQHAVHHATVPTNSDTVSPFDQLIDRSLARIFDPTGPKRGLSSGIRGLDQLIGGFQPGQLVIVGARPGCGKSVLLTGFARTAAIRKGASVGMWSLEMAENEIMYRLLSAECDVPLHSLTHGTPSHEDAVRLRERSAAVKSANLWIDDTRPLDLPTLRSRARRIQQRHGLDMIVVDYLQLMNSTGSKNNRVEQIGEISRGLKILAGDLGVPVIAAAQLNRQSETRVDRRPQLSDLRESGSIEADADVVILLHKEDHHNPEHKRSGEIDVIVAKNRNGPQDVVTAAAQFHKARILDMAVS